MKFKFFNSLVISLILLVGSQANAGVIVDGYEWLDLGITSGKSQYDVENNILTQIQYRDYEYATAAQVNALFISMTVGVYNPLDNVSGWKQLIGQTAQQQAVYDWFAGGFSLNLNYNNTGVATNTHKYGWFTSSNPNAANSNSYWVGHIDLMYNQSINGISDRGIYDRSQYDSANMAVLSGAQRANKFDSQAWLQHALVKKTNVPEPSTLVIFALGLIGLASRRFKKQ